MYDLFVKFEILSKMSTHETRGVDGMLSHIEAKLTEGKITLAKDQLSTENTIAASPAALSLSLSLGHTL